MVWWFPWIIIVPEYYRVAIFRLGRLKGCRGPGIVWRSPMFDRLVWVDLRMQTVVVPAQHCITSDNVPIEVRPVIFMKVADAARVVVAVENYLQATSELAVGTVRDVMGQFTLQQLLSDRDTVSARLTQLVNVAAREWGVEVRRIAIKSIGLSAELRDSMAQAAAAERQRRAMQIRAQAEADAAAELAEATRILDASGRGLAMRYLQVIQEVSNDGHPIVFMPRGYPPRFEPEDVGSE